MWLKVYNLKRIFAKQNSIMALIIISIAILTLTTDTSKTVITTISAHFSSLKGKTIVIDPGHGGRDPGAVFKQIYEKDINLKVALELEKFLTKKGAKVILTRNRDVDYYKKGINDARSRKRTDLNQRISYSSTDKADIFVSIHVNKDRHQDCYGMETFFHPQSVEGKFLASKIQDSLLKLQPRNRRNAKSGDYYVLKNTKMPAVIIEIGYLSNPEERSLLIQTDYQIKVAKAITKGLEDFFAHRHEIKVDTDKSLSPTMAKTPIKKGEKIKLFFLKHDPVNHQDTLALEYRTLEQIKTVSTNPSQLDTIALANGAIEALIAGPKETDYEPLIPKETQLLWTKLNKNTLIVNFSKDFVANFDNSIEAENLTILSIVKTLTQLPKIDKVQILVEGKKVSSLGGHVDISNPLTASQLEKQKYIAIVIDDLGGNFNGTSDILSIPYPLTLAVMPNLEYSKAEANNATEQGHEVILHMPMEAVNAQNFWYGPDVITTKLTEQEIKTKIELALKQIPQAKGISNHMGSKATADEKTMSAVIDTIKAHNLYIFDSRTTIETVIPDTAQKLEVPYSQRTVFLDNSGSLADIRNQLQLLFAEAEKNSFAIGIGHVGPSGANMATALKELLPQFEAKGAVIVPVSELLDKN